MATKATVEKWLGELTHIPTASGLEQGVASWVTRWVSRRPDLRLTSDSAGNLLITRRGRKRRPLVVAVAHMDHPAFVVTDDLDFEFRGGVDPVYFDAALVDVVSRRGGARLRIAEYDPADQTGRFSIVRDGVIDRGDIGMWVFPPEAPTDGLFHAPACDDLAGVAAALGALDRARSDSRMSHYAVLLTRAEEIGLIGAIHAAKIGTIPKDSRVISIETSRELPTAPLGAGPIVRTGDRPTVFDRELTNRISVAAADTGIRHQRKLMDGGGCEATAFGAYGYASTGLCIALRNWHNRGNLEGVEAGTAEAVAELEAVSLDDFHGLVDLILLSVAAIDEHDPLRERLDRLFDDRRHILDAGGG